MFSNIPNPLARLMQIHSSAAAPGGLSQGGPGSAQIPGLPPGLLNMPGVGTQPGLPTSIALLAGIPTSLAQAGQPHPAFASLLAQQKPSLDHSALVRSAKDEELKRAIAAASNPMIDTNGSKKYF